ncbi:MAG: EAL domain-containing protein [Gammaproteobacteria bacterium]|nr:EAL domain-containing protein [Gammaproteobacteria bacterium]MDH5593449.1 EAL domain-containing protein [Gammaproteobacteria bacterium]MDH5613804.1 EAL domain-containing protein [Gammaproteobacteria bacterium]
MTLNNKIMALVVSLVLFLGGTTIGIYNYFADNSIRSLHNNWTGLISQTIAESTATHIVNRNILHLNRILKPIVSGHDEIEYAFVVDFEGNIISYTFAKSRLPFFIDLVKDENKSVSRKIRFNNKEVVDYSYQLVEGLPARIHVGVNNSIIIKAETDLIHNILTVYFIVAVIFILISYVVGNHITKPVTSIIEQMNTISMNKGGGKLEVRTKDKYLVNLISAFNKMIERRIRSEQELRVNEENTRLLLNHIGEAVYGIDLNGNCTFANPACARMLGYNNSLKLIGKNMHRLIHHHREDGTELPEEECNIYKAHREGTSTHIENEVFWKNDGSYFYVEYWSDPLYREGDVIGSVISFIDITDRIRAHKALEKSRQGLAEAQKISDMGNWEWNICTGELSWSDHIFRIFGFEPGEFQPTYERFIQCVHPEDRELVASKVENALEDHKDYEVEHRIILPDNSVRIVYEIGKTYLEDGEPVRMIGTVQDITIRQEMTSKMSMLSSALEQSADIVLITDNRGIIEYVNPAFESITGFSREDAIGHTAALLNSGKMDKEFYKRLWGTISSGKVFTDIFANKTKDGTIFYEEKTITPLKDARGNIINYISTGKDISERIETQERLRHMAHHDALTGLPNRTLLMDRLEQATSRARWHNRIVGVMFLDLDRFKTINDTLGHDVGDTLLKEISSRLLQCVRDGDTVARLGGDEFAIILNDMASEEDVSPFAQKIIQELNTPFLIHEHELFITTSIGICVYPEDGEDAKILLKKADTAMYRAKNMGRNNYQYFTSEDNIKAIERLKLENDLRRALERDEFRLHFQPQLDLHEGKLAGMEALLRWQHPEHGLVSPGVFIPILEDTGMILPVGEWVLRTACRHARSWLDAGLHFKRIAVNLSARQFNQQDLVKTIREILDEEKVGAHFLELELTEGLLVENFAETSKVLHELHKMGVYISIDDFGTGYSSMNYLKRLPVDSLKIDYSFVRDITLDPDDANIASAIVSLAHSLGLTVIAEGVETLEQLNFLLHEGCDEIQGFLFSPPLPPDAVQHLVLEGSMYWEWNDILREQRWNKTKKRV